MTTSTTTFPAFDPTQPLGHGVTVLEASAGTGKTHAVASLVVAEVAAGRPLEEILVVTFTRKATGTLRERVSMQLASAVAALDRGPAASTDPLLAFLGAGSAGDIAIRRDRLADAWSNFDAGTIATTHGFCQQVLAGLGVAGDAERDMELLEDVSYLVADAVHDLFVRRFHAGNEVLFNLDVARRIAKAVIANPDAEIADVDRASEAAVLRKRFARTLRDRIRDQKRRSRLVTYDDLLTRLADSIDDPVRGAMVVQRLRRRFSMAVVDEFQDTDTVQWRILRAAFGTAPSRLVLVGDPKQAIYAFRGGDVYAYLEATEGASRLGLDVSWRADQSLLDGIDAFFAGAALGALSIRHRPLKARPGADQRRLIGPAVGAPLTVRIVDRGDTRVTRTPQGYAEKSSTRRLIARDVAAEAVRILSAGTSIVERDSHGVADEGRPLQPGDLAVLVRRHRDAESVRDALRDLGVPAVVHGGSGVLTSEAARDWLDLLRALEQPASTVGVRAVACGPFFGWDATRLATAADEDWDRIDERLRDWVVALRMAGIAGLMRRIEAAESLSARLLASHGGDRRLADLHHMAELLHTHQAAHPSSPAVLARWLAEEMSDLARAGANDTRRRLESDASAVVVQTVHSAKGLEFPVVLLPSLWEAPWIDEEEPPVFHDKRRRRCIGVGGNGPIHQEQMADAAREAAGEELRFLYVAMTRARHRVVLWWACGSDAAASAFGRVLAGRDPVSGSVPDRLARFPDEQTVRLALAALATGCPDAIAVEEVTWAGDHPFRGGPLACSDLDVSTFDRRFDRTWVRTSYTGLTAALHPPGGGGGGATEVGEVDEAAKVDEPDLVPRPPQPGHPDQPDLPALPAEALPLGEIPGGARIGTLVHEILERTDFAAADLPAALAAAAGQVGARRQLDDDTDTLLAGVAAAIGTPLGPRFSGQRLRDLTRHDRLDELAFDFPLAGGDTPQGVVTMDAIADIFATRLPPSDPIRGYHVRLRDPLLATEMRGFLTGSIDLVARVGQRHHVIDYKTNRLAPAGEPLSAWHYRPDALLAAMQEAHYPLQACLYLVALHRYLRWRMPAYQPDRHLGGAGYLFLRGMSGPDVALVDGQPGGVFVWQPPVTFVTALSELLDRGAP